MNIEISGHNLEVTDALRAHAEDKLQRIIKHFDAITRIEIKLSVDRHEHVAKGNIHVPHEELHAEAKSDDMYVSISQLCEKLLHLVDKHKSIVTNHHSHDHE